MFNLNGFNTYQCFEILHLIEIDNSFYEFYNLLSIDIL